MKIVNHLSDFSFEMCFYLIFEKFVSRGTQREIAMAAIAAIDVATIFTASHLISTYVVVSGIKILLPQLDSYWQIPESFHSGGMLAEPHNVNLPFMSPHPSSHFLAESVNYY